MKNEMYPIRSQLHSKRIKFDVPQNTISWAFMKELRENNATRKIYPIEPYVEVYQFREGLYGLFTENCDGMGDVWMYLIVGPEKAMLIDTAFGLGDLKGLVEELAGGRELIVVNTHDHFDHAYGNCRFDKVYCHEYLCLIWKTSTHTCGIICLTPGAKISGWNSTGGPSGLQALSDHRCARRLYLGPGRRP